MHYRYHCTAPAQHITARHVFKTENTLRSKEQCTTNDQKHVLNVLSLTISYLNYHPFKDHYLEVNVGRVHLPFVNTVPLTPFFPLTLFQSCIQEQRNFSNSSTVSSYLASMKERRRPVATLAKVKYGGGAGPGNCIWLRLPLNLPPPFFYTMYSIFFT